MKLSVSRKQMLQRAADQFHRSLNDQAWAYLSGRGVDEGMVNTYALGLVSEDSEPAFAPYVGRLSIPFITPTGTVAIRFRCIEDHDCEAYEREHGFHKKYLQMKGEGDHLYNVGALHERHPAVGITEGEVDAMFADTYILPTVGVPGATKWRPYWGRLFEDFERVFVIGDGDRAGREFCDKLAGILPNAQPVVFPDGLDVNGFYLEHGPDALSGFVLGSK